MGVKRMVYNHARSCYKTYNNVKLLKGVSYEKNVYLTIACNHHVFNFVHGKATPQI